jgi:essential nuclear protein 1
MIQGGGEAENSEADAFVPARLTQKILRQAREQQLEDAVDPDMLGSVSSKKRVQFQVAGASGSAREASGRSFFAAGEEEEDDEDGGAEEDDEEVAFGAEDEVGLSGEFVGMRGGSGDDASVLRRFMPDDSSARRTLADIIMEKLAEAEARAAGEAAGGADEGAGGGGLDPRVVAVYTDVGKFLASYKSGKLPKVMKVIPALPAWEEVLFLTNPETWTPHATYAATRIFASNLNAAKAQRFFNLILLPKCRDDIFIHKKLNFHLYLALKKATYKPAGFYRGILLPLAAGGDCTLQEAVIFASVLMKSSIPQLHSAAALIKMTTLPYCGAVSIFVRALLDKKYTLPYLALDAVADHFLAFMDTPGPLPLLWHTALLALARRYKGDLTAAQKEGLRRLTGLHTHAAISAEVCREFAAVGSRGNAAVPSAPLPAAAPAHKAGAATQGGTPGRDAVVPTKGKKDRKDEAMY